MANFTKHQKGGLWALAAAGGLWAWQNRDKIQGWVKEQSQGASRGGKLSQPAANTGATRRIHDYDAPSDSTEVQRDPFGSGI